MAPLRLGPSMARPLVALLAVVAVAALPAGAPEGAPDPGGAAVASCEGLAPVDAGCVVGHLYDGTPTYGYGYGFGFPACKCFAGVLEMDFIGDAWGAYYVRCQALALPGLGPDLDCVASGQFPVLNSYWVTCRASPYAGDVGSAVGSFSCWARGYRIG